MKKRIVIIGIDISKDMLDISLNSKHSQYSNDAQGIDALYFC